MSLIDKVTGALGGMAGGTKGAGVQAALVQQLVSMLSKPGALGNLSASFQQNGLGNILQSWMGSGQNLPISAEQVQQVLGKDTVGEMAKQAGVGTPEAAGALAGLLPQVIDRVTPNGQEPSTSDLGDLLSSVGKRFGC